MKAEYSIKRQIGGRGFFGRVYLECVPQSISGLILDIDKNSIEWKPSIEFACSYFLEHSYNHKGIKVNILEIHDNPVDTSSTIIVFIIIKALESILGKKDISLVEFNEHTGKFIFEK